MVFKGSLTIEMLRPPYPGVSSDLQVTLSAVQPDRMPFSVVRLSNVVQNLTVDTPAAHAHDAMKKSRVKTTVAPKSYRRKETGFKKKKKSETVPINAFLFILTTY